MASPDVFLSSPPRGSRQHVNMIPTSSPDMPPLQELLSQKPKKPTIRSGSKAVPIPDDAKSTFTSARELWKSAQSVEVNLLSPSVAQESIVLLDDIETAMPAPEDACQIKSPSRKSSKSIMSNHKCRSGGSDLGDEVGVSTQPWKKYKSKTPEKDVGRRSISPDRDNLGLASDQTTAENKPRETTPVGDLPKIRPEDGTKWNERESLLLEPAMVRRKNWTPPTKSATIILDSEASTIGEDAVAADQDGEAKSFGSLLSAYKCSESSTHDNAAYQSDGSAGTKRKVADQRVDSVVISVNNVNPVSKPKAPRKKPRTITGLATAAYRQPTQAELTDVTQDGVAVGQPKPLAETSKKPKARKKPTKTKKKPEPPKPVLFSPETALKQVAKQDFVFGTSSQLATEQSPTFLRELQLAMKDSNQLDYVDFTTPLNSDAIEPPEARPKLWDAAARDIDGDLFDVEVVNLTGSSPRLAKTPGEADPFGYFKGDDASSPSNGVSSAGGCAKDDGSFVDIADILPPVCSKPTHKSSGRQQILTGAEAEAHQASKLSTSVEILGSQPMRENANTEPLVDKGHKTKDTANSSRPTFEQYTDVELSKKISQYGFKPVKRRSAMIALLDQCWRQIGHGSQQRGMKTTSTAASPTRRPRGRPRKNSVDNTQIQEPPPSAQAPETPKRGRGRPRKDSQPTPTKPTASKRITTPTRKRSTKSDATVPQKVLAAKVIEIPDSESEVADALGSSPLSSQSSTFSSPEKVNLTMSVDNDTELSLTMTPTDAQTHLFTHITKAVTTAPRTTDPANPSWYEKILMYDPIVLEDLASWLNSGQLSRVGYDEEVNPVELKKWCESKSICCLWKINLRGKERKRY
ncbi:NUDIX family hydrolase [Pochonia chlamydosporia 170]|uniref:Structure-specific endonuclease subunit SLX4 n=1 Tax=Pochonia chlamydosporia 170 TaxID=1380566 RepID=A0A179FCB3_METCM|nr:NUDIX family hydrolase [Pochonia chlamydosporia 170]OAQ62930.1 NUDIX family hydrolase [Pochonia chlamydosporia 170]